MSVVWELGTPLPVRLFREFSALPGDSRRESGVLAP